MLNVVAAQLSMAKKVVPRFKGKLGVGRHFVKEWRKYRGWTQERLAECAGMTPGNLSLLENHRQGFSRGGLERISECLNCEPGHLLSVNPLNDNAIWSIWETASQAERSQIVSVARALVTRKSGT